MNRRDFLFLAKERETAAELSCEQLFMRCVDSALDGSTAELFNSIEQRLASVTSLSLASPEWLNCDELKPLETILARFRQRGGWVREIINDI